MRDDPATPATDLEEILASTPLKAFKRTFGVAPGAYRGQPNQVPGLCPAPEAAAVAPKERLMIYP
jgi:hypothetical protein